VRGPRTISVCSPHPAFGPILFGTNDAVRETLRKTRPASSETPQRGATRGPRAQPWGVIHIGVRGLKGRDSPASCALTGLSVLVRRCPRAAPWAFELASFRRVASADQSILHANTNFVPNRIAFGHLLPATKPLRNRGPIAGRRLRPRTSFEHPHHHQWAPTPAAGHFFILSLARRCTSLMTCDSGRAGSRSDGRFPTPSRMFVTFHLA
jgi:hypothetical protein